MSDLDTTVSAEEVVNEFDQPVEGVSLARDAWRRLKKNKMAMFGFVIVVIYAVLSITAPILPIYSFRYQVSEHRDLPPSLSKTSGQLWYERVETRLLLLAEKEGRSELNEEERAELAEISERIKVETAVIDGEEVLVHQRHYLLGTDPLGRDMLARIIYGGQISIAIGLLGTFTSVLIGIVAGAIAGYVGGKDRLHHHAYRRYYVRFAVHAVGDHHDGDLWPEHI